MSGLTIADVLNVPCPTCKRPADVPCIDDAGAESAGVHNTRIYRYQVVTEALAHNAALIEEN